MARETKIISWGQVFLYTGEYHQQLRKWSLLVIVCHI